MKHWFSLALAAAALAALPAMAQLDGKTLVVKGGKTDAVNAPVTVDYDGPAPEGRITLVAKKGKDACPATLRDGKLTFILDELKAGAEKELTVKIEKADKPRVLLTPKPDGKVIEVTIDGKLLTAYYYGEEWKKPFLWPINSEDGVTLTRSYPMDGNDKPRDHPHHKSMWSAYGDVNGADCWMEEEGAGLQKALDVTFGSGDAYGWVLSKDVWTDKDGKVQIGEEREYRFYAVPEKGRFIDERIVFTANDGDVKFGDTKEGGILAVRMRGDICGAGKALITNALGDKGEKTLWGKPSPWCDFSGDVPKAGVRGIAIFDNPANLRYPTSWHVRDYGLMGANCFGYSHFSKEAYNKGLIPENGDLTIKKGESVTFNYRVYIHGGDAEKARVADRYADYATPPAASWK